MNLRHPSRRTLREWLDTGGPASLDEHIGTCLRCAGRVEDLAEPSPAMGELLSQVLAPPVDLVPRLSDGINSKLRDRADLRLLGGMLGLPIETTRLIVREPPSD